MKLSNMNTYKYFFRTFLKEKNSLMSGAFAVVQDIKYSYIYLDILSFELSDHHDIYIYIFTKLYGKCH
jgi:hypothetical protein